jgi:hypothetical protein
MQTRRIHRAVVVLALLLVVPLWPGSSMTSAASKPVPCSTTFAQVQMILHGLQVAAPKRKYVAGKVKQQLARKWALRTRKRQLAAICLHDGSRLDMNQETNAILTDPTHTRVKTGEIRQFITPGTNHQVVTAEATASAVGTRFDLKVSRTTTSLTVIEGAVLFSAPTGRVVVTTGERSTVRKGKAPTRPVPVNALAATAWTKKLPPPSTAAPPENLGLAANGGSVAGSSGGSGTGSSAVSGDPHNATDGDPGTAWETNTGSSFGQSITIGLPHGDIYTIAAVALDCAAPGGDATRDLKGFTVSVSSTGSDAASFRPVLQSSCGDRLQMQRFDLPSATPAGLVRLTIDSNHGSSVATDLAEFMVIGSPVSAGPMPTPSPSPSPSPTVVAPSGPRGYQFTGLTFSIDIEAGGQVAGHLTWTLSGHECGDPVTSTWTGTHASSAEFSSSVPDQSSSGAATWTIGPDGAIVPVGTDSTDTGAAAGPGETPKFAMSFTVGAAPAVHLDVDYTSVEGDGVTVIPAQQTVSVPMTPYTNCP